MNDELSGQDNKADLSGQDDKPSLRGDAARFRDSVNQAARNLDNFFRHGIEARIVPAAAKALAACKSGLGKLEEKIKARSTEK